MGYDLYVQGAPTDEVHTYLRRTIAGMGEICRALMQLDMACISDTPSFPTASHLCEADFSPDNEPRTDQAVLFMHALENTLIQDGTDPAKAEYRAGKPLHTFTSNDKWQVTSTECHAALRAYTTARRAGEAHPQAFEDDVIPFLRTAAQYAGFRVC